MMHAQVLKSHTFGERDLDLPLGVAERDRDPAFCTSKCDVLKAHSSGHIFSHTSNECELCISSERSWRTSGGGDGDLRPGVAERERDLTLAGEDGREFSELVGIPFSCLPRCKANCLWLHGQRLFRTAP